MQDLDGIVIGCYEGGELTKESQFINQKLNGELKKKWNLSGKKGKSGESVLLLGLNEEFKRIAMVGLGEKNIHDKPNEEGHHWREGIRNASSIGARLLKENDAYKIGIESFGDSQASAEGAFLGLFSYDELKTKKEDGKKVEVFPFVSDKNLFSQIEKEWNIGIITATSQNLARTLAETPSNLMTPTIFSNKIQEIFQNFSKVQVIIRDKQWIEEKKMGCFLGVTKGSNEPPKFIEVHYNGTTDTNKSPLVLVGKGITFDSGGISIKPSSGMSLMKGDMSGAAAVISSIYGIASLNLPINVIGLTPLCENMPSGNAIKPGDVLFAMNGKSVEVDNTDAEGRLILADGLHYAHSFKPHTIIDIATLTGAIGVALGSVVTGVFSNNDQLWNEIHNSGYKVGELVWRMPLLPQYKKQMESKVADIKNSSETRTAGACTAAIFLKEFVECSRWMHIDMAGVMNVSDKSLNSYLISGMTGIPVRTLIEFASNISI